MTSTIIAIISIILLLTDTFVMYCCCTLAKKADSVYGDSYEITDEEMLTAENR